MSPRWAELQARWFAAQGFVVVVPMRRGYGQSDGPVQEGYGKCEEPNFHSAGLTSANDIGGVLDRMSREPFVDARRIVIVGQSAGGWGGLAASSRNPPGVVAIINFAGGRGSPSAEQNCAPERLVLAAGRYGAAAKVPSPVDIHRERHLFRPEAVAQMFDAYRDGGAPAEYHLLPAFGRDGHALFSSATAAAVWQPLVTDFLRRLKLVN